MTIHKPAYVAKIYLNNPKQIYRRFKYQINEKDSTSKERNKIQRLVTEVTLPLRPAEA